MTVFHYHSAIAVAVALWAPGAAAQVDIRSYEGMCDASAVVSLEGDKFVVANDEDNILRIYRLGQSKPLRDDQDLSAFLESGAEVDIEGAARVGSRIYWITSHGANRNAKPRPERRRFFATDIVTEGDDLRLVPVGQPYRELVADLVKWDDTNRFDFPVLAQRAPEAGGLNIEGLVARPDGTLLLAFRSPVVDGVATLVPILNPAEMVSGAAARLGPPIALDLGGLGIRSIETLPGGPGYVIAAGPVADGAFRLFLWDGQEKNGRPLVADPGGMSPEAIAIRRETTDRLLLFSDDGDVPVDAAPCKEAPAARRAFRGGETGLQPR